MNIVSDKSTIPVSQPSVCAATAHPDDRVSVRVWNTRTGRVEGNDVARHSVCIPLNRCPPPSDRVHITVVRGAGGPPPWHSRLSIYGRTCIGEAIWRPNQRVAPPGGDGPKCDGPASARLQRRREINLPTAADGYIFLDLPREWSQADN